MVNLDPVPAGDVKSIADIQQRLGEALEGGWELPWLIGWGFNHASLSEHRFPTRDDLDADGRPNGVVEEHAMLPALVAMNSAIMGETAGPSLTIQLPADTLKALIVKAQDVYLQQGFTRP